ncbi:hypothetical protein ACFV5C_38325, partial [Streptomyces sp. NPDC059762]
PPPPPPPPRPHRPRPPARPAPRAHPARGARGRPTTVLGTVLLLAAVTGLALAEARTAAERRRSAQPAAV